jgi:hypothetical protein
VTIEVRSDFGKAGPSAVEGRGHWKLSGVYLELHKYGSALQSGGVPAKTIVLQRIYCSYIILQ